MKNKTLLFIILLFSICSFAVGCQNSKKHSNAAVIAKHFESELSLKADSVQINSIIKPGNIYYVDPYILISDVAVNRTTHFFVFDRNLNFLYTFCNAGQGDSECILPSIVKNSKATNFIVRDHATDIFHRYSLNDSTAKHIGEFRINTSSPVETLWEMNMVDDNHLLVKGVEPKSIIRRLIDLQSLLPVDSMLSSFNLKDKMKEEYYYEFEDFWIVSNGRQFANAYYFIDRIDFGEILNNRITIKNSCGASVPPDFFPYTNEELNGKYQYNVDYNIVYYEWLFGTEDKVFASYFGKPWGEIENHSNTIESYDYDGKPDGRYKLNIPLASFIIVDNKLIGVNPDRSDEYLFVYSI